MAIDGVRWLPTAIETLGGAKARRNFPGRVVAPVWRHLRLQLGQAATTLSGGEAQRMKLSAELAKKDTGKTVYLLDEPTTGLHFADVAKLLEVLERLRDKGNTLIVIEHNLDVVKTADWIVNLGPEGGEGGGEVVAAGTPEDVAAVEKSYTGQFLRPLLAKAAEPAVLPAPAGGNAPETPGKEPETPENAKKRQKRRQKRQNRPQKSRKGQKTGKNGQNSEKPDFRRKGPACRGRGCSDGVLAVVRHFQRQENLAQRTRRSRRTRKQSRIGAARQRGRGIGHERTGRKEKKQPEIARFS